MTATRDSQGAAEPLGTSWDGVTQTGRYVRWHPAPFVISVVSATLFAAMTVASAWVLGMLTDEVILPVFAGRAVGPGDIWLILGAVLGVAMLRVVGIVGRRFYAGMFTERVNATQRQRLARRYVSAPVRWLEERASGTLLAHAEIDVERAGELLHPVPFSIAAALIALFSLGSLISTDPVLAVIAFALFPTLAVINQVYSRVVARPAVAAQEQVGRISAMAAESFDGALVVKTLGREAAEGDRFAAATDVLRRERVSVGRIRAVFETTLDLLPNLGMILVLVLGTYRVDAGIITPGEVVQVVTLFNVLAFPMRVFGFFLETIPSSVVAQRRIDRALVADHDLDRRSPGDGTGEELAFRHVRFGFEPDRLVLDDVTFGVDTGEVVALVGTTGSGKSAIVELISGLRLPAEGHVEVAGVPTDSPGGADLSDTVAIAFQEAFLFADSIGQNIDMGRGLGPDRIRWAAEIAAAHGFIMELPHGYDTVVGERGVTLSGGQRQRVALARAIAGRPQVLVLDDATSAVDPHIEQAILGQLRSEVHTTTLIVAQRVATIRLADRVMFLSGGRIVAVGSHAELMATVADYRSLVTAYES